MHRGCELAGTTSLRIHLFGGFRVIVGSQDDAPVVWRQPRAAAVVKLLALESGHQLHREQLMELLWPELEIAAAANNLKYTLYVARRVLEPKPTTQRRFLQWQGDRLALAPDCDLWIDVDAFEDATQNARRSPTLQALQQAIDLYTGDLLPEDPYEDWAFGPRERLRAAYVSLLMNLAAICERSEDLPRAIATLERVVSIRPRPRRGCSPAHARVRAFWSAASRVAPVSVSARRARG